MKLNGERDELMAKVRRTGIAELAMRLPLKGHLTRLENRRGYNPFDPRCQFFPAEHFADRANVDTWKSLDGEVLILRRSDSMFNPKIPKLISKELMEQIVRGEF